MRKIIVGAVIAVQTIGLATAIIAQTWWAIPPYVATTIWCALWWQEARRTDRYRAWLEESYERERALRRTWLN